MDFVLPSILCGPIVRRTTVKDVWIWMCCSQPIEFTGACYLEREIGSGMELVQVGSVSDWKKLQVGEFCFATLIRLSPKGAKQFPIGQPIFFDLRRTQHPVADEVSWGLEADLPVASLVPVNARTQLPSFLVPPQVDGEQSLRFLYSSCRRAADEGDDAVALAIEGLEACLEAPKRSERKTAPQRPHLSLMIGDQIYADDVAPWLAPHVQALASQLIGREETIPSNTPTGKGGFAPISPWCEVDGKKREAYLRASGFTSEKLKFHCASLGEFVALYCLTFASLPLDRAVFALLSSPVGRFPGDATEASAARELHDWLRDKEKYRRLLANVATYFILDDHEVTDDWNIDGQWKRSGKNTLRDKYVIPNALLGYFAFQGWGNDPGNEQWNDKAMEALQGSVLSYVKPKGTQAQPNPEFSVLEWHWDYSTPTQPAIILLDTRTYRSHEAEATPHVRYSQLPVEQLITPSPRPVPPTCDWILQPNWSNTVLLNNDGMLRLEFHLSQAVTFSTCIIVSPCVVFGFDWLDRALDLVSMGPESSRIEDDRESWASNPMSYAALFKVLQCSPFKRFVFLSGDVHFGYQMSGTLTFESQSVRVLQAVSSASKNEASARTKELFRRVLSGPSNFIAYWFQNFPKEVRSVTSRHLYDLIKSSVKPNLQMEMKMMAAGQNEEFLFRNNWGEMVVANTGVQSRLLTRRSGKEQAGFERWDF